MKTTSFIICLMTITLLTTNLTSGQPQEFRKLYEQFLRTQGSEKSPVLPKQIKDQNGITMVLVPAGEFQMGGQGLRRDQRPVHTVFLDSFYVDAYEVTNAQFRKFLAANSRWRKGKIDRQYHDGNYLKYWRGMNYPAGQADSPVVYVSWYAATAYARWAGKTLPTEAQWEKAARGRLTGKQYPWGDTIKHYRANYLGIGQDASISKLRPGQQIHRVKTTGDPWEDTSPIGSFEPNGYGLYDMAGNVWEWCADAYQFDFYTRSPRRNPANNVPMGPIQVTNYLYRVIRGGGWNSRPMDLGVAVRSRSRPSSTSAVVGFRCVQAVP